MNGPLPPCLQRLALSLDADSKAIRRAYARELKLIDQEHDLPGFQLLRDAYEAALAWDKYRNSEPEPLTAMPDVDPHALACASLERLAAGIARIVADGASDAAPFETEIRDRLADDELLNITARSLFEARIGANRENGKNRALRRFGRAYRPQTIPRSRLANALTLYCIVDIYDRGRSLLGKIKDVERAADGSSRGRQRRSDNLSARRLSPQRVQTHPHRAGEWAVHRPRLRVLQAPIRLL